MHKVGSDSKIAVDALVRLGYQMPMLSDNSFLVLRNTKQIMLASSCYDDGYNEPGSMGQTGAGLNRRGRSSYAECLDLQWTPAKYDDATHSIDDP
jgi:hypothetical protein